jgi:hypothetical protein
MPIPESVTIIANTSSQQTILVTGGRGPAGEGGGGGSSFLTDGVVDVDATYIYVTGLDANSDWAINRYNRSTQAFTTATQTNNPSYNYTTQAQLRSDRATLTYG